MEPDSRATKNGHLLYELSGRFYYVFWSERQDSNLRPLQPHSLIAVYKHKHQETTIYNYNIKKQAHTLFLALLVVAAWSLVYPSLGTHTEPTGER